MNRRGKEKNADKDDFLSSDDIVKTYENLKKFGVSSEDLIKFYGIKRIFEKKGLSVEVKKKDRVEIPVTIFSKKLSCLETIVKYLKENLDLSNKEISRLTNRSEKTIWQAYDSAKKKLSSKFKIGLSKFYIPASILSNRKLSCLENIVKYLHENFKLNYSDISRLLQRDNRTIWTVYSRAIKKYDKRK